MRLSTFCFAAAAVCAPGLAVAGDLTITFGNNSWDTLSAAEYAPAGSDSYTAIALADGTLAAGGVVDVTFPGGAETCLYDLRFTKADGSAHERPNVDLCAESYYHFADG